LLYRSLNFLLYADAGFLLIDEINIGRQSVGSSVGLRCEDATSREFSLRLHCNAPITPIDQSITDDTILARARGNLFDDDEQLEEESLVQTLRR
jgi:hypothetical protein